MMRRLLLGLLFVLLLVMPADAVPPLCTVSGVIFGPTGATCNKCLINFDSQVAQTSNNNVIARTVVSSQTDSAGNMTAITLPQGVGFQVTINGAAPLPVFVPFSLTVLIGNLMTNSNINGGFHLNDLLPPTGTVNMNSQRLINLGVDTTTGDALSRGQSKTTSLADFCATAPILNQVPQFNGTVYCPTSFGNVTGFGIPITSAVPPASCSTKTSACTANGTTTLTCQKRVVIDGVTNGTTTITSATANFVSTDVGAVISGTNIPASDTIASVTNTTTALLTTTASGSGSGITFTIGNNGISDFLGNGEGIYLANSGAACSINGGSCTAPTAPTVGRAGFTDIQCNDVTVSGGGKTYTTLGGAAPGQPKCDFSWLQANDAIYISGGSAAGDNGYFTVNTATATVLTINQSPTGEASGSLMYFQTVVPIAGTTITVGNSAGDLGAVLDLNMKPYPVISGAVASGTYTYGLSGGVGTLTFQAQDYGKPIDEYYEQTTPVAGSINYCFKEIARDAAGGYTPASAATCVTTASITFPTETSPLWVLPSTVTGAYAYDMYESDNAGAYYYAMRIWPPQTTISATANLPQATITVIDTKGFPTTGSFVIGGQTVTYTGTTANTFTGCTGGTSTFTAGTPIIGTAPNPQMQFGQGTWSNEDTPVLPPTAAGNDDLNTTITTATGAASSAGTLTLGAAAGITGAVTASHIEDPSWTNLSSTLNTNGGGVATIPGGCTTRVSQLQPCTAGNCASNEYILQGNGQNNVTSIIQVVGDGGGPVALGNTSANGGVVLNGSTDQIRDLSINTTNSALTSLVTFQPPAFGAFDMSHVDLIGKSSGVGANQTTGVSARLFSGYFDDMVIKNVVNPIALNGGVNGFQLRGVGSLNQIWDGRYRRGMIEYEGANFNNTVGPSAVIENAYNVIRPATANATNKLLGFLFENNYVADIGNQAASALANGFFFDFEGAGGTFGPSGGFGSTLPGLGCWYFGNAIAGLNAIVEANSVSCGSTGVLAENGPVVQVLNNNFTLGKSSSQYAVMELRGNDNAAWNAITGATNGLGYRLGYKADESTCFTTVVDNLQFSSALDNSLTTDYATCPTVQLGLVLNDSGVNITQGTKPTVTSCGGGSPSVVAGSTNVRGSFVTGTSAAACTLTFATAAQGTQSGSPTCTFVDVTSALTYTRTVSAAPTSAITLTFSNNPAGAQTWDYQCSWDN